MHSAQTASVGLRVSSVVVPAVLCRAVWCRAVLMSAVLCCASLQEWFAMPSQACGITGQVCAVLCYAEVCCAVLCCPAGMVCRQRVLAGAVRCFLLLAGPIWHC